MKQSNAQQPIKSLNLMMEEEIICFREHFFHEAPSAHYVKGIDIDSRSLPALKLVVELAWQSLPPKDMKTLMNEIRDDLVLAAQSLQDALCEKGLLAPDEPWDVALYFNLGMIYHVDEEPGKTCMDDGVDNPEAFQ